MRGAKREPTHMMRNEDTIESKVLFVCRKPLNTERQRDYRSVPCSQGWRKLDLISIGETDGCATEHVQVFE